MTFVYLAASLPLLSLDAKPPFSMEAFRMRCSGLLAPKERSELERMLQGQQEGFLTVFGRAWAALQAQMDNECARQRNLRLDQLRSHSGFSVQVRDLVLDAFNRENPLARERVLDAGRFALLEELAQSDPYGLPRILAFAGQLRLVHRWAGLDKDSGRKRFASLVEETVQSLDRWTESIRL
jgi:hypothetical protein